MSFDARSEIAYREALIAVGRDLDRLPDLARELESRAGYSHGDLLLALVVELRALRSELRRLEPVEPVVRR
jgi:hypothetical protein